MAKHQMPLYSYASHRMKMSIVPSLAGPVDCSGGTGQTPPCCTRDSFVKSSLKQVSTQASATSSIAKQQLIDGGKGAPAGVATVERGLVERTIKELETASGNDKQQWKKPFNLNKTLLGKDHGFVSVWQHSTVLGIVEHSFLIFMMATCMCRHYIHSLLKFLQHILRVSMEHTLSFICSLCSVTALLKEFLLKFFGTWIECLVDQVRYRPAIEHADIWHRKVLPDVMLLNDTALFCPGKNSMLQRFEKSSVVALKHDLNPGKENTDLILPDDSGQRRLPWIISKTVALGHFVPKRTVGLLTQCLFSQSRNHSLSMSILVLSVCMNGVYGQGTEAGKDNAPIPNSGVEIRSPSQSLVWWILWMLTALLIPVIGPKLKFSNETGTSFILAFVFAISKNAVGSKDGPNLWVAVVSGISLGSSLWLTRVTIARQNSIFVHVVRYFGLAALVYDALCSSKLGDQNRRLDLSMTLPELSVLSSALTNALYNEKMRQLVELIESTWGVILGVFRLQHIPPDDIV